jgi:ribose transport system substrate-binding protein
MKTSEKSDIDGKLKNALRRTLCFACFALTLLTSCKRSTTIRIAVIPRTTGTMMWEPEHRGVLDAGLRAGAYIYWNAPTREDDVQGQIAMVQRIANSSYQGLILSPDHDLALIEPVRKLVARGITTVVVGSPLAMPPGGGLSYILNDEETGGRIAAERVGDFLHGSGTVAILGIDPDIAGIVARERSFERSLADRFPKIHVLSRQLGSFNAPHEEQMTVETLKEYPDIDAIVALTSTSAHGVLSAIRGDPRIHARVVIFDPDFGPDSRLIDTPNLDCYILQNMRQMGEEAASRILAHLQGDPMPPVTKVEPVLVTRQNINSAMVQKLTSMDWQPPGAHWKWKIYP